MSQFDNVMMSLWNEKRLCGQLLTFYIVYKKNTTQHSWSICEYIYLCTVATLEFLGYLAFHKIRKRVDRRMDMAL